MDHIKYGMHYSYIVSLCKLEMINKLEKKMGQLLYQEIIDNVSKIKESLKRFAKENNIEGKEYSVEVLDLLKDFEDNYLFGSNFVKENLKNRHVL